ncbi:four helix bundle protein [Pararcticibacter amylolyticus]|uniref:Diversity-generating retroelement protein bAvd family protein n=1 Tax=Pararcticibacter amylolyticus TaxID=2173175 RepID=A0A2U2PFT6_9SPHI|nr:four helix bundle protein [Pararcticibacter amylolyticus]PWG80265.1 diversity-generating retroelement protein bAvd family protein [Pararcticibacter amylolyticus]
MRDFQKLSIWQKSHLLTIKIYSITKTFPKEELYGLTSQARRSASSIPTNIAEGCGRNSIPDFKRFLMIAAGSASELHYQLILSRDLHYISESIFKELSEETILIKKMIFSYIGKLAEANGY